MKNKQIKLTQFRHYDKTGQNKSDFLGLHEVPSEYEESLIENLCAYGEQIDRVRAVGILTVKETETAIEYGYNLDKINSSRKRN